MQTVNYYIKYPKCKNEDERISTHLSNYVRKRIREDVGLSDEERDILLTYPIVYVHAWNESDRVSVYVGETNDLVLRIGQHANVVVDDWDWHTTWLRKIDGGEAFSFFFGSRDMNKSMCLDIENSLVSVMKECSQLAVKTKATTAQIAYSNKSQRNEILNDILSVLSNSDEFSKVVGIEDYDLGKLSKEKFVYSKLPGNMVTHIYSGKGELADSIKKSGVEWVLDYPVVYLYLWLDDGNNRRVYVGETDNILNRHLQHIKNEEWANSWAQANEVGRAYLAVFCQRDFNKSMTLDLENRMIKYLVFHKLAKNLRFNEQGNYSDQGKMYPAFLEIIDRLRIWQADIPAWKDTFKTIEEVKKGCVSLLSFYKLNDEQVSVKERVREIIEELININSDKHTVLVLYGKAGTGKTVLLANLLFDLISEGVDCKFMVNNSELAPSYKNMMSVWRLGDERETKHEGIIYYANDFINKHQGDVSDVLLIDEGHLLNVRDHTGRAKSQLDVITDYAKVTVMVFDPEQFVDQNKKWECDGNDPERIRESLCRFYKEKGKNCDVVVENLDRQMRMQCEDMTRDWIDSICTEGETLEKRKWAVTQTTPQYVCVRDSLGYELCVFDNPKIMKKEYDAQRRAQKETMLLATYDWAYGDAVSLPMPSDKDSTVDFYWHQTGKGNNKRSNSGEMSVESWIRNADDNEIGSYHDIQGFDLETAIVVIGPSVSYRGGKIHVIANKHKKQHDPALIMNQLRVLLTRGVKGLYIYACNKELRKALMESLRNTL